MHEIHLILLIAIMITFILGVFIIYTDKDEDTQNHRSTGEQPTSEDFHKVINFMLEHNIINHDEQQKIIRKSLPYL